MGVVCGVRVPCGGRRSLACGLGAFVCVCICVVVGGLVCLSGSVHTVHLYFLLPSLSMSLGSWWCFVQGVPVGDPIVRASVLF